MKKRKQKHFKPPVFTTIIGKSTRITGDVAFSDSLHLDGEIHGNILGEGDNSTLTVSDQARIRGDVRLDNIIVNGRIEGNIHAEERVELTKNGVIIGKIEYSLLEMAMGASVEGEMIRLTENREDKPENS